MICPAERRQPCGQGVVLVATQGRFGGGGAYEENEDRNDQAAGAERAAHQHHPAAACEDARFVAQSHVDTSAAYGAEDSDDGKQVEDRLDDEEDPVRLGGVDKVAPVLGDDNLLRAGKFHECAVDRVEAGRAVVFVQVIRNLDAGDAEGEG
eukprot:COSAG04_NODE_9462_length_862_cov_1.005242_1_plen_150_part_10